MIGRILHRSDYQSMPWKNGGGTTTEIWKATSPAGEMLWRLSIADVASDGPFSDFPGVDRWIMAVEGAGMELAIEGMGTRRLDRLYEPLFFPGDVRTRCRLLGGPIRDFNFMIRRSYGRGSLQVLHLPAKTTAPSREGVAAVHVFRGTVELKTNETRDLAEGDSWVSEQPRRAKVRGFDDAIVAVISIETSPMVAA
jgi:environmental stress-induced protein Ves